MLQIIKKHLPFRAQLSKFSRKVLPKKIRKSIRYSYYKLKKIVTRQPTRRLFFVERGTVSYSKVEKELSGAILKHLPKKWWVKGPMKESLPDDLTMSFFIRQKADVLMSHGVADKSYYFMTNPDTGDRYVNSLEYLLVPGEWLKNRLVKSKRITLKPEQIHVVGWPRLDALLIKQKEYDQDDTPFSDRRPRVLWAPTHDKRKRGPNQETSSTYPDFEKHIPELEKVADVKISLHPRNRKSKQPTGDELLWADYVISDFGTMVYEAWALEKAVIFPRWILRDTVQEYLSRSAEAYIHEKKIGLHPYSMAELIQIIKAGDPKPGEDAKEFLDEYIEPSTLGCSGKTIAGVLERALRSANKNSDN